MGFRARILLNITDLSFRLYFVFILNAGISYIFNELGVCWLGWGIFIFSIWDRNTVLMELIYITFNQLKSTRKNKMFYTFIPLLPFIKKNSTPRISFIYVRNAIESIDRYLFYNLCRVITFATAELYYL